MLFNRAIAFSILTAASLAAGPAFSAGLCTDRAFEQVPLLKISTDASPAPGNEERIETEISDSSVIQALYDAINEMKTGWRTPTSLWSLSATRLTVIDGDVAVCQFIYDRKTLYTARTNDTGFVVRSLSYKEYASIKSALNVKKQE